MVRDPEFNLLSSAAVCKQQKEIEFQVVHELYVSYVRSWSVFTGFAFQNKVIQDVSTLLLKEARTLPFQPSQNHSAVT